MKVLIQALAVLAAIECFIGLITQNVHVLRDFLITLLLLASLLFTQKSID